MNRFDWIVFDSTGTLMAPHPEPAEVYARVGARFGSSLSTDVIRSQLKQAMTRHFLGDCAEAPTDESHEHQRWQRIVRDSLTDVAGAELDETFSILWQHFASHECWKLFDDVQPTILRLRDKGYRIGIASNFDSRLKSILRGKGIESWFDAILISSDLGWSKPNRRFYDVATERLGDVTRERLLMIGDTPHGDVEVAKASGWNARLLRRDQSGGLVELTADL